MFSKLDIYPALCIVSFITPECPFWSLELHAYVRYHMHILYIEQRVLLNYDIWFHIIIQN
jgi:hypothetical protein